MRDDAELQNKGDSLEDQREPLLQKCDAEQSYHQQGVFRTF